ncbi:MAG: AEC family transporter [Lachnospiraceae bacterium]|nr:AEC family transporter [Lachnospiraceae bacterium]MDE7240230.1 AEC family transporter [Lachnospiraceae bacterium]
MDIQIILHQLITLFLLMGTGFLLFRLGFLNTEFNRTLTRLLINVTMPFLIIDSVLQLTQRAPVSTVFLVLAAAVVLYLILPLFGYLIARLLFVPKAQRGLYTYMTTFSNVGFMGFPLISALLGAEAVFYTALFNMIFNLSSFSYGILLISSGGTQNSRSETKEKPRLRMLLSPGILLSLLAIVLYFANLSFPAPVVDVVGYIGGLTTPLAMLLTGASIASMNLPEMLRDWRMYPFILLKQIALPLCLYPLFCLFIQDTLLLHVSLIMLSLPVANSAVLFSIEYRADEKLATRGVFLTTLFSIATIPLVVFLCL